MRLINYKGWRFAATHSREAKEEIERALRLDADNAAAYIALGLWYFFTPGMFGGDLHKALRAFEKAVEAAEGDHERFLAHMWLGQARLKQGAKEQARAHFEQALSIYPQSRWAQSLLKEADSSTSRSQRWPSHAHAENRLEERLSQS